MRFPQGLLEAGCPEELPPLKDGRRNTVRLTMLAWAEEYHSCRVQLEAAVKAMREVQSYAEGF